MTKKKQLDQLQRLVHLISDDNELLSQANTFMQNLVDNRFEVRGKRDISAELAKKEQQSKSNDQHQ